MNSFVFHVMVKEVNRRERDLLVKENRGLAGKVN